MKNRNDSQASRRDFLKQVGYLAGTAALASPVIYWLSQASAKAEEKKEEEVSPAEDLMREHGVLERLLLIYETASHRLSTNEDLSPEVLASSAGIIRDFIENYHEKLEEDYLFPRLIKAGKLVDLVKTLQAQHDAGRQLTDIIRNGANLQSFKDPAKRTILCNALNQYIRMYRPHASREDTILFPAFKEIVPEKEYKELGEQFEEQEHQRFGEGGFQAIVAEVTELEKRLGIYDLSQFTPEAVL